MGEDRPSKLLLPLGRRSVRSRASRGGAAEGEADVLGSSADLHGVHGAEPANILTVKVNGEWGSLTFWNI